METSSRNSQVVHAGIYYPAGSLKARLCVEGRDRVYGLCRRHEIPFAKTGKLITATRAEELPALDAIAATALGNGVALTRLSEAQARALEPRDRHRRGALVPGVRDRGCARAHGPLPARGAGGGRRLPAPRGGRRHRAGSRGIPDHRPAGRRSREHHRRARRQRGGARRGHGRRARRDRRGRRGLPAPLVQGQLLLRRKPARQVRIAPRVSSARSREPRRARRPRYRRPAALRARRRVPARSPRGLPRGRPASARSSRPRRGASSPPSATKTSSPTSAASGRSSRARASPSAISSSRRNASAGCPASTTSSESSRPD